MGPTKAQPTRAETTEAKPVKAEPTEAKPTEAESTEAEPMEAAEAELTGAAEMALLTEAVLASQRQRWQRGCADVERRCQRW